MLKKLEALEKKLQSHLDGNVETEETVDLLNAISAFRSHIDPAAVTLDRSRRAFALADRLGYKKGMAGALMYEGASYWYTSRFEDALSTLARAKSYFSEIDYSEGRMAVAMYVASVYRSMGDLDESFLLLAECEEFFRQSQSDYWKAVSQFSLGMTCLEIGDHIRALQYLERAAEAKYDDDYEWLRGRVQNTIGAVYSAMGRCEEALTYQKKALEIFRLTNYGMGEAAALNDIGGSYRSLQDYAKALQHYEKSLEIRRQIQQREAQCTSLINVGELFLEQEKPDQALPYVEEALSIAESANATPRVCQAHHALSRVHEMRGDLANALRHERVYVTIKAEITRKEADRKTRYLKTRFEVERAEKDAEIERLRNVELKGKNEELELLLAKLNATQSQLIQSEKMAAIGKIVAGVMHEINTPLGASACAIDVTKRCLTQIAEELESLEDSTGKIQSLLTTLLQNQAIANDAQERISSVLNSLRSFTRMDEASFQEVDIHEGLDSVVALLEPELGDRIEINKQYGTLPRVTCYAAELNQVFMNLLTNAVESIDSKGAVSIRTSAARGSVIVEIEDTGAGIPPDRIEHLFEPQFTTTGARVKTGLGLVTSYNIVEKHRGSIVVDSEVGRGSTVRVTVPIQATG